MSCEWGYTDCTNLDKKCHLCFTSGQHYMAAEIKKPKPMAKRQQKADKRMGGNFEAKNHQRNEAIVDTGSKMTINSGAWIQKGDEQIRGMIHIMEELKTKVTKQAPGKESFTMQKKWLEKLNREAREAGEEFWYLKFSFNENDPDVYIAAEQDVFMSMVVTMVDDRKKAALAQSQIDVAESRARLYEAQKFAAFAEINHLKAKVSMLEKQLEIKEEVK